MKNIIQKPEVGRTIIVDTSWGEKRRAVYDPYYTSWGGYRLVDCTHPMQNCYLCEDDILNWRYGDDEE